MSNLVAQKSWHTKFAFAKTTHGGPPEMDELPVAASQTIVEGDPLTLSSGELSLATAASVEIAGFAAGNVTTTAADEKTPLQFYKATDSMVFIGRCDAASNTINVGDLPGIRTSGGIWYVDIGDDNATNVLKVIDRVPGDLITDSTYYGRVYFVVNVSPYIVTNT
jgi:hypothetical protein